MNRRAFDRRVRKARRAGLWRVPAGAFCLPPDLHWQLLRAARRRRQFALRVKVHIVCLNQFSTQIEVAIEAMGGLAGAMR